MTRALVVRIAGALLAAALLAAGCSRSDDEAGPSDDTATSTTQAPANDGTHESIARVASRRPTRSASRRPRSRRRRRRRPTTASPPTPISITHIRVTLEDLEALGFAIPIGDPADQAKKFVGLINDRCGGINGRKLDLRLVEAPPLAPAGQDPAAIAQAACIEATEDNKAVFAFSGQRLGRPRRRVVRDRRARHHLPHDVQHLAGRSRGRRQPAVLAHAVVGRRARVSRAPARRRKGVLEGKTIGVVMAGRCPAIPRSSSRACSTRSRSSAST